MGNFVATELVINGGKMKTLFCLVEKNLSN